MYREVYHRTGRLLPQAEGKEGAFILGDVQNSESIYAVVNVLLLDVVHRNRSSGNS